MRIANLRVRMYLEVRLYKDRPGRFHTASRRSQGVLGKGPLAFREAMMRSTGSMSVTVSWRKMAWCRDLPGVAP